MEQKKRIEDKLQNTFIGFIVIGCILTACGIGFIVWEFYIPGIITAALGLVVILMAVIFYRFTKKRILKDMLDFSMEYKHVQNDFIYNLEIPYAILDKKGKLIWCNGSFREIKDYNLAVNGIEFLFKDLTRDKLPSKESQITEYITYDRAYYRVKVKKIELNRSNEKDAEALKVDRQKNEYIMALYLFDETRLRSYVKENLEQRLMCGIVYIDNYDDVLDSTDKEKRAMLAAIIERDIAKYFSGYDAILSRTENDRFMFVMQQKHLHSLQENKFSVLDEIRELNMGNSIEVTLSIGIGADAASYAQAQEWARNAIDLALGRGGDQAVVKQKNNISYYGGKAKQVEKNSSVRARVKAHALRQLLETKDRVIIMGHRIGDMDSLGAAVGISRAAKVLGKKPHIVFNEVTKSVKPFLDNLKASPSCEADLFIGNEKALQLMDDRTALVIVDVNKAAMTECPELVEKSKATVLLDHHRQSKDSIENAVLSYVEPFASSTVEMVIDILVYIDEKVKLSREEANTMYGGLMVDTNNFVSRTTVRTFEAAAFLKGSGADITEVRRMLSDDVATFRAKARTVGTTELFDDEFAFAVCSDEGISDPAIIGAQAANELLQIAGVKASFVFTKVNDTIFISARSMGDINVQLVMEKFNGGGHSTMAGAQLKDISVEAAMANVKMEIRRMKNEGEI